jgi:hypothetical protein
MGLSFLTPWLLAGGLLIAAPIILHLLMRQQPKPLIFPALRFVQLREQRNKRSLRLRHLLLLAARCLAIVLLALALARPSLQSGSLFGGGQDAPVAAAFVFDTAPRMEYRQDNQTRLEAARTVGDWLLTQLPPASEVAVFDSSTLAGDFAPDLVVAKQRVEALKTRASQQPLAEMLQAAFELVKNNKLERREVYLFTDLARAAWPERAAEQVAALRKKYADIELYLIDASAKDPKNTALGDLRLNHQVLSRQGNLQLEVPLSRVGGEESAEVAVYLLDDKGQPQKKGQTTRTLRPDMTDTVQFRVPLGEPGTYHGTVRLLNDDALAEDNIRYFSVEVRPARQILIAAPKPAESYAFFLKQALDPEPLRRAGQARFDVRVVTLDELAKVELGEFAAVCLLDPESLAPATAEKLRDYVKAGGGLAIWLGHNAQLKEFNTGVARELLPGALEQQWRAGSNSVFLAPTDLQHPVLAAFRGTETNNPWIDFPVRRHWQFDKLDPGVTVITNYNNRMPALLEKPLGRGKILCMTTPVSENANDRDAWNTLATGFEPWPFVMLSNEMLLYLAGTADERFNYVAGEEVLLQIPEAQRGLSFTLTNPAGDVLSPNVNQVTGLLRTQATEFAGHYRLRAGGTEGGVTRGFSVNIPASLSELTRLTNDELDARLGKGTYHLAKTKDEIDRTVSTARTGTELFPLLILLVAALLGGEFILSNKFYKRDDLGEGKARASLAGFGKGDVPVAEAAPNASEPEHAYAAWPTRQQAPPPAPAGRGAAPVGSPASTPAPPPYKPAPAMPPVMRPAPPPLPPSLRNE